MKKRRLFAFTLIVLAVFCVGGLALMRYYAAFLVEKKVALEERVASLQEEYSPMRFRITRADGSTAGGIGESSTATDSSGKTVALGENGSGDAMVVEMKFLDTDGNVVNTMKATLQGGELFIYVSVVQLKDGAYLFFPYKVFTDEIAPIDGIPLYDEYDADGFPAIYGDNFRQEGGNGLTSKWWAAFSKSSPIMSSMLMEIFCSIKDGTFIFDKNNHGNAVHDMKELSGFKSGFVYRVVCHPHTGAVEVVR